MELKNRIWKVLALAMVLLSLWAAAGCGQDTDPPEDPPQVEQDPFYFNLDKALDSSVIRAKDRKSGLYTFRFLKDGEIVSISVEKDEVAEQIDRMKTAVIQLDDNGYIKKSVSAQAALGGSFYDGVKIQTLTDTAMTIASKEGQIPISPDAIIYDLTGLEAPIPSYGQLQLGDVICGYATEDGIMTHIYILERQVPHDNNHLCDHCQEPVQWQQWDGIQPLTSGHYTLADNVTLSDTVTISAKDVVLCLAGRTLKCSRQAFVLEKGATLTVTDHTTYNQVYKGKILGGGFSRIKNKPEQMRGGVIFVDTGCQLNIKGGEVALQLSGGETYEVMEGGAIYCKGTVELESGTLTGADVQYNGGALHVAENGVFRMRGGVIRYGNALKTEKVSQSGRGGTIYVHSKAKEVDISGGKLIAGTAVGYGGGIYTEKSMVITGGEFTSDLASGVNAEYGGIFCISADVDVEFTEGVVISGGSAVEGGNIACRHTSTAILHSGVVVRDGYGERNGGNIAVFGTLDIRGAQITGGYTPGSGGNIFSYTNGTTVVNLHSGTVSSGSAGVGGNICMSGALSYENGSVLNIYGGQIVDGEATKGLGGNVTVRIHSQFVMTGGQISGGKADEGGDVAVEYNAENKVAPTVILGGSAKIGEMLLTEGSVITLQRDLPFTSEAKIGIRMKDPAAPVAVQAYEGAEKAFSSLDGRQILYADKQLKAQ